MTESLDRTILFILVIMAVAIGGWAIACLASAWAFFGVSGLIAGWFTSIGTPATMVAYYSQIKGVEYIICAAFLALFPVYYKVVNRTPAKLKA
jgi:hypothetical protein